VHPSTRANSISACVSIFSAMSCAPHFFARE
jgi:hypothetical protein